MLRTCQNGVKTMNKIKLLGVRATESEKKQLKETAKNENKTVSDYIRESCFIELRLKNFLEKIKKEKITPEIEKEIIDLKWKVIALQILSHNIDDLICEKTGRTNLRLALEKS